LQLVTAGILYDQLGRKYFDETELLPLLLEQGLIYRVRTIEVEIQPLGGDSFKVTLDIAKARVGEARTEIMRVGGTPLEQQDLYKLAVREDGGTMREDDTEPEMLEDDMQELADGDVITLAVRDTPLVWRTCNEDEVELSADGAVARRKASDAADW
jgi:hypothetical protein